MPGVTGAASVVGSSAGSAAASDSAISRARGGERGVVGDQRGDIGAEVAEIEDPVTAVRRDDGARAHAVRACDS